MTQASTPSEQQTDAPSEQDYDLIKEALMNNPRGRWFLQEYVNRNRPQDTQKLLDAIGRIEKNMEKQANPSSEEEIDPIRLTVIEMSQAINKTRQEIASIKPAEDSDNQLVNATEELGAIVESTEQATNTILEAAEEIQEAAWILREAGSPEEPCDKIDNKTTDIYTACSFQDITGQRTNKIVQALYYIENRVNAMIDIWGLENFKQDFTPTEDNQDTRPDSHLLNGPALFGEGLDQTDIDDVISNEQALDIEQALSQSTEDMAASDEASNEISENISIDDISFDSVITDDQNQEPEAQDHSSLETTDETAANVAETELDAPQLATEIVTPETQANEQAPDAIAQAVATPEAEVMVTPEADTNAGVDPLIQDVENIVNDTPASTEPEVKQAKGVEPVSPLDNEDVELVDDPVEHESAQLTPETNVDEAAEQEAAILATPDQQSSELNEGEVEDKKILTAEEARNEADLEMEDLSQTQQTALLD